MSDLSDLVHRLMRDVTLLNPMEPGAHFLAMLEAKGLMIVKKVEGQVVTAGDAVKAALEMAAETAPSQPSLEEVQLKASQGVKAWSMAERLIAEAKAKRTKT